MLLNSYDKQGYIYEYWLLKNADTKLDFQHRIIWELRYGKIPKGYEIHHINRNKKDNQLGELKIFTIKGYIVYKAIGDTKISSLQVIYTKTPNPETNTNFLDL